MFEKILYPTDCSEVSLKAMESIKKLYGSGCRQVIVLRVIDEKKMDCIRKGIIMVGKDVSVFLSRCMHHCRTRPANKSPRWQRNSRPPDWKSKHGLNPASPEPKSWKSPKKRTFRPLFSAPMDAAMLPACCWAPWRTMWSATPSSR